MSAQAVTSLVLAYLIGGIPVGLFVGRARGIPDIRKLGSGNIGASNVLRVLGPKAGILVWVTDCLKGAVPVLLARHVLGLEGWALGLTAVAATCGHCFSVYLGFSGGRGVSTGLGATMAMLWVSGLCALLIFVLVVARTRYISLGSIIGAASAPLFVLAWGRYVPELTAYVTTTGLLAAVIIARHGPNIRRLMQGTERKIGEREHVPEAVSAGAEDG